MSERVIGWDELKLGQRVRIEREWPGVRVTYEAEVTEVGRKTVCLGGGSWLPNGDDIVSITLLAEPLPPEPPVGSAVMQNRGSTAAVRQTDCWRWACEGTPVDPLSSETAWERLHADGFRVVRHGWDGEQ